MRLLARASGVLHRSGVSPPVPRLQSVDLLRGIVCVLMAIDHVRVYSGIPAGGPEAGVFLTRWVTHFVAPAFCFLAGTSAFLHGRALGDPRPLARFLAGRGLLLVVLELTLIRFLWAFEVGPGFALAGVIWMLGWCMVLLAPLVRFPAARVGWAGVALIALQQLFSLVPRLVPEAGRPGFGHVWNFIYPAGAEPWSGINILYVLVPWIGVMMAGYGFGALLLREAPARDPLLRRLGWAMTALFLVAGSAVVFATAGDPGAAANDGADPRPFWMRLLDQQKYPASQLFLLMTLGPMIALVPWAERARGWAARALVTIGRVPMFYYLAHILVIHLLSIATMQLRFGEFRHEWYATAPYTWLPERRWEMPLLYLVWAVASVLLYFACAWYARRKATAPAPWMRYL